jgi:2-oxoglutarate ferredoxin oxidoreductase subunit gamma
MEREIILTGVGGQGVQLGGQILARAATLEKREVMYLGTYGGTMRGGNTDTSIVVADGPIHSPPILSQIDSALAMHHAFWQPVVKKLRPGGLVVVNSTVFEGAIASEDARIFEVPATRLASDLGNPLGASLILIAAYANLTGLVKVESLVEAMRQSVPAYRRQHLEANERTLREGFLALPADAVATWTREEREEAGR